MKKSFNIIILCVAALTLVGCNALKSLHSEYKSQATIPADVFGENVTLTGDSTSIAGLSWREFFTDPLLQRLIDTALIRNTDINSARIAIQQSQASLKAAKQAFFPSVVFSPSGSISSFGGSAAAKTYNVPLQVNWDIDAFGSIKSNKRKSEVLLMQAQTIEQAVKANIISAVAQQYCTLLLLDHQQEILLATDSLWKISLETQKTLWENGKSYSTAVNQMEASYLNVKTSIVDNQRNIRQVENAICSLLAITPRHIERSHLGSYSLPKALKMGVPAMLLQYRPDVKLADYALAEAYYDTQAARAAFYPSISLQGLAGWTNDAGAIVNPGKILLNAVASLSQPIYAQGKLKANLKINQLEQEKLMNQYVQTVIDAGNEVNEALADCQAAIENHDYYHRQVEVLKDAYRGTHELMDNGKAIYLEVLTAQETLLNAQLNEAINMYNGAMGIIELYIALGGATR
ncbi:MAG: TolC family protein [Bacteroidales bacterium]|nr:TolC family protein [Bacteroidales bacterium]